METDKKEASHHEHEHHHEPHQQAHHQTHRSSKRLALENAFVVLAVLLGIILIINIFTTYKINSDLAGKTEELREKLRPGKIDLVIIKNSRCADCLDMSLFATELKKQNLNVTSEKILEFDSQESKQLVGKYKVEKIPALIATGEIDKVNIQGMEKREDALLLSVANPPYTNAANGEIIGRVIAYYIKDPDCKKCGDLGFLLNQIKFSGVRITSQKNITATSSEGRELIGKYGISFVPSIILSKDASAYQIVQQVWPRIGTTENDGSLVLRSAYPPFINLTTGEIKGIVNITYITDKGCGECYNVNLHKSILTNPQSFGFSFDNEETFDISDDKGKALLGKYNINSVPTIILYGGVQDYQSAAGLNLYFSVESDGSYVFRKPNVVGVYKDLATNNVVRPNQNQEEVQA